MQAQVREHLEREIQKIITFDSEIDFAQTPGLAVGLVWGDSSYFFSYGVASKEDSLPLSPDHLFEIGELTQVFTAALVLKLSREGHFSIDDKLVDLLGLEGTFPEAQTVTLRHCLQHTSGFPRFLPGFGGLEGTMEDPYSRITREQILEFLVSFEPEKAPPLAYSFSNLNYAILALTLERKMGQNFEDLLRNELLQPLGLENTLLHRADSASLTLAQGYNTAGQPVPMWGPSAYGAALGIRSTPSDLTRFLNHLLKPHSEWEPVFSELYADPVPTDIRKRMMMGFGWHLFYPKKKVRVLVHTGSTGGYMAYMALRPESGTGVFVLANSPFGAKGLGMFVLSMLNEYWKK